MSHDKDPQPPTDQLDALLHAADQAAEAAFAQQLDPQEFIQVARRGLVRISSGAQQKDVTPTPWGDDDDSAPAHGEAESVDWVRRLSPMDKALLERLAAGSTVSAAATAEFLSLRTANRRIAELRRRAGVTTTRALVGLYRARR